MNYRKANKPDEQYIFMALLPILLVWEVNGVYLSALSKVSSILFWLVDFLQWIVLPSALLCILFKKGIIAKRFGLETNQGQWTHTLLAALTIGLLQAASYYFVAKFLWYNVGTLWPPFKYSQAFPSNWLQFPIYAYSALTAGVVESIFFIGLPWMAYQLSQSKPSVLGFIVVGSLLFGSAHWEQGFHALIAATFSGMIGYIAFFLCRKNLWPIIIGHILADLILLY